MRLSIYLIYLVILAYNISKSFSTFLLKLNPIAKTFAYPAQASSNAYKS
jgi:hypothetical protein